MSDFGPEQLRTLADELQNFQEIMRYIKPSPGELPHLDGIDIDGDSLALTGAVGGDHTIYLDFNKRYDLDGLIARATAAGKSSVVEQLELNKHRAGILMVDVAGHRVTDALVAAMLHQAFLLGSYYEMEYSGQITTKLLEHIKTRFYESTNIKKLVALIYGEISDEGRFRWVSAGHAPPLVYSREYGRIMPLGPERTVSESLVGMFPAAGSLERNHAAVTRLIREEHVVNQLDLLGHGDILLLATDGFTDHGEGRFVSERLPQCLERVKDGTAKEITACLRDAILTFAPRADDISFVVIKRL